MDSFLSPFLQLKLFLFLSFGAQSLYYIFFWKRFVIIIIRKLANSQSSIAFAFYGSCAGLILSGIFTTQNFVPIINNYHFLIFIICGIVGGAGGLCISGASKILESSVFAPIQYVQLIAGFVFGYLFFKDLPDTFEILGSLIIIISGLFIIYRESKLGLRPFTNKKSRIRDLFHRGHWAKFSIFIF